MSFDPDRYRNTGTPGIKPPGIFAKAFAVVATVAIAILALTFSVFVFAIALAVGVIVWGWLWWKMRGLKKQMERDPRFQEMRRRAERGESGEVIEGVVIREVHETDGRDEDPRR
jgi:O-antigen/teichoic acid export membrane protein